MVVLLVLMCVLLGGPMVPMVASAEDDFTGAVTGVACRGETWSRR
jgi:hypothetical protein